MLGVEYASPAEGGLVTRHGKIIGRLTSFGQNRLGITCSLHKCGTVVHGSVTIQEAARWLAHGIDPGPTASAADWVAARAKHLQVPWPRRKPDVWHT